MNAALLVMSSALAAGGDVRPAIGYGEAPAIVQVQGCTSCGPTVTASCGCGKVSFFDKIKARFAPKSSCGCAPAPKCSTCETSYYRPNLLDKIKSHGCKKPSCGCEAISPCATPGAPVVAPTPTTPAAPPKDMPKLKEVPKTSGALSIPAVPNGGSPVAPPAIAPTPVSIPSVPTAPISSSSNPSAISPY